MLELSEQQAPLWAMNVAGDTLNTAWHFKRLAGEAADVAYLTALGNDPFSARIEGFIADAGIETRFIRHEASRGPGLNATSRDHAAAIRRPRRADVPSLNWRAYLKAAVRRRT